MKILHIDDHKLFVEGLTAVIHQRCGNTQVLGAYDMPSAWQILEQRDDIDLILFEIDTPQMDCAAFIESLKQLGLKIPYAVLSGSEDLFQIRHALDQGALGFIPKSYMLDQIRDAIGQMLAGEIVVPEDTLKAIESLPAQVPQQQVHKIMSRYNLGKRQMDVLKLMKQGYSNDEIAQGLNLSINTIKTHSRTLFTSFQVNSRHECVRYAERIGLL